MDGTTRGRLLPANRWLLAAVLFGLAGCVSSPVPTQVPTAKSIEGLPPSGTVSLTQITAGGAGVGQGVLTFRGKKYPFKLAGSVIGPGGASRTQVAGDVYRLEDIAAFAGIYTEGTGSAGLETSGKSELWLENKAGVVMYLTGTTEGITLSLGREEVILELSR
ncbi:MAG: hypothetical protein U1E62_20195 [Alsobacter sp.]